MQFNKKLLGLTMNKAGSYYVSDKFGDIYSLNSKGEQKYLNSNLGIPTLLKYFNCQNKNFMVVGDE